MADFVAVLRKTIDGLGDTTPETRARVYDKARATISGKLAAMNPQPAAAVIERQKKALEDAIGVLEAEYVTAAAPAPEVDDLDEVMAQLTRPEGLKPVPPTAIAKPAAALSTPVAPARAEPVRPERETAASSAVANGNARKPAPSKLGGIRYARVAVALIALVFAIAAAYAIWINRDEVSSVVSNDEAPAVAEAQEATEPAEEQQVAAADPAPTPAAVQAPPPKFTQKLNADGSETDPGPAGGKDSLGEGTSMAAVTTPPATPIAASASDAASAVQADGAAAPDAAAEQAAAPDTTPPAPSQDAVAVGQRAIFYEERTTANQQTAEQGNVVWSLVQESPGNDLPPEAAIRAESTIPGKDIQLRMTIRRNADETLPASHIVELIFLTPESFEGGAIDNVLRMTFKETEEATGNPLLGIPAKIGDGFFLIALNDGTAETEANLQLMRRMRWIDIPVVYRSGRRALMTMERGVPGDKVFEDALKDWATKSG